MLVETGSCVSAFTAQTAFLMRLVFGEDQKRGLVGNSSDHGLSLGPSHFSEPPCSETVLRIRLQGFLFGAEQGCFEDSNYLKI